MKKAVIVLLLIVGSLAINARNAEIINHDPGQSILSFSPTVLLNTPNGIQLAGGIKFQLFLSERLSIDADIVLSNNYFHLGPGVIGVPIGFLGLTSDDEDAPLSSFLFSVAAIALSFEHISYHIPVTTELDISPYVSLLRYKSSYEHSDSSDPDFIGEQLSFATGVQMNRYYGRFVLSPYGEYNIGYKDLDSRFNIGVYLGIYFRGKNQ
jgi:hypothetical protein